MTALTDGDVKLDRCPQCGGVWFDLSEFGRVVEFGAEAVETIEAAETNLQPPTVTASTTLTCPVCHDPLSSYEYAMSHPVTLNGCPVCSGIFLKKEDIDDLLNWEMHRYTRPGLEFKMPTDPSHPVPDYDHPETQKLPWEAAVAFEPFNQAHQDVMARADAVQQFGRAMIQGWSVQSFDNMMATLQNLTQVEMTRRKDTV